MDGWRKEIGTEINHGMCMSPILPSSQHRTNQCNSGCAELAEVEPPWPGSSSIVTTWPPSAPRRCTVLTR
jgi:hypothetical protein